MKISISDLIIATMNSNGEKCSYYSLILSKCKKIETRRISTMAVSFAKDSSLVLLYNPDFVDSISVSEATAVLKHEAMHIFLGHLLRFKDKTDHELVNIACDMAINQYLKGLPEGGVYPNTFGLQDGSYAEAYYEALKELQKQQQQSGGKGQKNQQSNGGGDGGDESDSDQEQDGDSNGSSSGSGKNKNKKKGKDNGLNTDRGDKADSHDTWKDVVDKDGNVIGDIDSEGIDDEQAVEKVIQKVAKKMMEEGQGSTPDWAKRTLDEMRAQKSKVNWKHEFRLLVQSVLAPSRRKSQKRVDRKLTCVCSEWLFAGKKKDNMPKVLMVRDTSGSIFYDTDAVQGMLNELAEISKKASTWVCDCDTEIKQVYKVKKATDFKELEGGGGTDFRAPFEYALKNGFDAVIYMTDLYGTFPDKDKIGKLARNTIWVIFNENDRQRVPFGKLICIPPNQLK